MMRKKQSISQSETVTALVALGDLLFFAIWYGVLLMQAATIQSTGEDDGGGSAVSIYFFFICIGITAVFGYLAGRFSKNFVLPCILHLIISAAFFILLQSTGESGVNIFAFFFPLLFALIFFLAATISFGRHHTKNEHHNEK